MLSLQEEAVARERHLHVQVSPWKLKTYYTQIMFFLLCWKLCIFWFCWNPRSFFTLYIHGSVKSQDLFMVLYWCFSGLIFGVLCFVVIVVWNMNMWRGDRAFCSVECRCKQIFMDEQLEEAIQKQNCSLAAMRPTNTAPSSSAAEASHHQKGSRNRPGAFAYW